MRASSILAGTLGKHLSWQQIRQGYIFLTCALLVIAMVAVLIAVYTRFDKYDEISYIHRYESIKVAIGLWGSVVLMIIACLAIDAGARLSYPGTLWSAVLLICWLSGMSAAVVASTCISDYTKIGFLYKTLQTDMTSDSAFSDRLQKTLHCCGVNNYTDWSSTVEGIPASCCEGRTECTTHNPGFHETGCFEALKYMLTYYGLIAVFILLSIGIVVIIVIIMLFLLYGKIRKERRKRARTAKVATMQIPRIPRLSRGSSSGERDRSVSWATDG